MKNAMTDSYWRDWMWLPIGVFIAANGAALASLAHGAGLLVKFLVGVVSLSIIFIGAIVGRWSYHD